MREDWASIITRELADILGFEPSELPEDAQLDVTEGWDSLAHAILVVRLEELFGQAIEDDEALQLVSLPMIQLYAQQRQHGEGRA